ncbi:MAG: hypothetical protein MUP66_03595, partial [Candidatus Nanohaloarchaeota archaeon QJJ-5]|nr:hypothetical protein [Candidatus Nanohaloarchaeota archaeon QJJ-5]
WTFVPHGFITLCYTMIVGITIVFRIGSVREMIEEQVGTTLPERLISHMSWITAVLTFVLVILSPYLIRTFG